MKKKLVKLFLVYDHLEKHRKALIMANLFLFLALFNMQLQAGMLGQKTVSMNLQDASLYEMLGSIEDQTGVGFLYNESEVDVTEKISVNAQNQPLNDLLGEVLPELGVDFEIDESVIVLTTRTENVETVEETVEEPIVDETIEVKGKITDNEGLPLPGATIIEKGTLNGITSDVDGLFILKVANVESILKISFIGFTTQFIPIADQTEFNIALLESAATLGEVVITGYQTLSRERSTGAFAQPDVKVIQDRSTGGNVLTGLDGLVAGLVVNNSPSSSDNPLLIRGVTTIGIIDANGEYTGEGTNRNPLYVVDGIAVDDVSRIDPQDVESINVLKDAPAASIWGSRAANGVIVITTKSGKKSDKIKIEYDAFVNYSGKPDFDYKPYLTSREFIDYAEAKFELFCKLIIIKYFHIIPTTQFF